MNHDTYDRETIERVVASLRADNRSMICDMLIQTWDRAEALEAQAIQWTPVTEALPPTMLRVLAVYNDGRATMTIRALHLAAREAICWEWTNFDEPIDYDEETGQGYYPEGWYEAVEDGEYAFIGPLSGTVTHWAHMPKLPEPQP